MASNKRLIAAGAAAGAAGGFDALQNFDTVTYTGNGGTQSITSLDFQPDLVWTKSYAGLGWWHFIQDSVRGTTSAIYSNRTDAAGTFTDAIQSFDSNGYTIGSTGSLNYDSSNDYVAWCWKAGGAAVSNTDGTITSQVSANQDAGFSIVKWEGTGAQGTIGHGLSSAPEMIISKRLENPNNWNVYHKDLSLSHTSFPNWMYLNFTSSEQDSASSANHSYYQIPSSTLLFQNTGTSESTNVSGEDYISYCFHSVDGYQRIGSYTGNDSSKRIYTDSNGDGTGTGAFAPRFLLIKCSSNGGTNKDWNIFDTTRDPSPINKRLEANTSGSEFNDTSNITINSDGFTLGDNGTATGSINQINFDYIYLAIA